MDSIAIFIDALKSIPLLLPILKSGKEKRRKIVFDVLAPLHKSMDDVRADYVNMFRIFRDNVTSASSINDLEKSTRSFELIREEMLVARAKVRSLLSTDFQQRFHERLGIYPKFDDPDQVAPFVGYFHFTAVFFGCDTYPYTTFSGNTTRRYNRLLSVMRLRDEDGDEYYGDDEEVIAEFKEDVIHYVDWIVAHLTSTWGEISDRYHQIELQFVVD